MQQQEDKCIGTETLQHLCIQAIIKNRKFRSVDGILRLYSLPILQSPANVQLKSFVDSMMRNYYPVLLEKFGYAQLTDFIESDYLKRLHDEYSEALCVKKRFSELKGTVVIKDQLQIADNFGYYPIFALKQGVSWPSDVDPTRREE